MNFYQPGRYERRRTGLADTLRTRVDSQSAGPIEKVLRATIKRTGSLTTALGLVLIIGFLVAGTTARAGSSRASTVHQTCSAGQ